MAQLKRTVWPVFALSFIVIASLAFWYLCPDPFSKYIATVLDAFAGIRAWLTAPVLFLLMNGVVVSLAFTSGFLKQRHYWGEEGELEDLTKISRRKDQPVDEEEDREKDEEEDDILYPEVFSSFFGDGVTTARRKPALRRSTSAPLAERKARSFYPSISGSLSQRLSPSPSLLASHNSPSSQPLPKALRPAHTVPKTTAFELKKPHAAIQNFNGNGDDKDVDQRADAFIGDFYKKMKLQEVDPYIERLERSYGR